jgi:hypothetical protein
MDLLFPSFCPHCDERKGKGILCSTCSQEIDLEIEEPIKPPSLFNDRSYALRLEGANTTLYRLFTKRYTSLTDPLSALLYAKILKLNWPPFQLLIPLTHQQSDKLLCKGLLRHLKVKNHRMQPHIDKNILIVSTLYNEKKLRQKSIDISRFLPKSLYSLSLWKGGGDF